jgi:hypothetical protein
MFKYWFQNGYTTGCGLDEAHPQDVVLFTIAQFLQKTGQDGL